MRTRRIALLLPVPVLLVAGALAPLRGSAPERRTAGEVAYHSLPDAPAGDRRPGRPGVERTAVALAVWLRAVPVGADDPTPCPEDRLEVSWTAPEGGGHHGAYVAPLGPAPTATTSEVNGVVVCRDAPYAYMGFEARWRHGRWDVVAVPVLEGEEAAQEVTAPEPVAPATPPAPAVALDGRTFSAAIEGLAAYEPQRTCDATAKPGTTALRNLLLRDNPGSRNLGIVRGCGVGGTSEHKEGRAFDWGVNVNRPAEKAEAEAFIAKLLATDEHGNRYALARRMGVMYVIWNQRIWAAYRAADGWRPYHGASPHTDHVHISLSWAGAQARTSFWSGNVVDVLLASAPTGGRSSTPAAGANRTRARVAPTTAPTDPAAAARRAAWEAERAARRAQWEAEQARRTAAAEDARRQWEERQQATADQVQRWRDRRSAAPVPSTTTTTTTAPSTTTTTAPPSRRSPVTTTTTTVVRRWPTTTTTIRPTQPAPTTSTTVARTRRWSTTTTSAPAPTSTSTTAAPSTTTTAGAQ